MVRRTPALTLYERVFLSLSPHTCTLCPMFSLDPSVVSLAYPCTCWRMDTNTRLCASHTCVAWSVKSLSFFPSCTSSFLSLMQKSLSTTDSRLPTIKLICSNCHFGAAALSAPMTRMFLCCSFASASFTYKNPSSLSVDLHSWHPADWILPILVWKLSIGVFPVTAVPNLLLRLGFFCHSNTSPASTFLHPVSAWSPLPMYRREAGGCLPFFSSPWWSFFHFPHPSMYHAVEPLPYSDHSLHPGRLVVCVCWCVSNLLSHDPGVCTPPLLLDLVSLLHPAVPHRLSIFIAHCTFFQAWLLPCEDCSICPAVPFRQEITRVYICRLNTL